MMKVAGLLILLVAVTLAVEDEGHRRRLYDKERLQKLREQNKDNPAFRGGKIISTWDGTEIQQKEWEGGKEISKEDIPEEEESKTPFRSSQFWNREGRRFHHGRSRHHWPRRQFEGMRRNRRPPHRYGADINVDLDRSWEDLLEGWKENINWEDLSEGNLGIPGMSFKWDLGDLGISFFKSFGVWWKGPNVCERVEETEEEVDGGNRNGKKSIFRHSIFTTSTCDETDTSYKCTTTYGYNGVKKTRTQIFECCHGYTRKEGDRGCPKDVELKDVLETAEALNGTELVEILHGLDLSDLLLEGNYTLFVPSNAALDKYKPEKTVDDNVVMVSPDLVDMAEGLKDVISAHIVEGFRKTTSLSDEEMLPTEHTQGQIRINRYTVPRKMLTANCVPLISVDNMATNGVVHVVDKVLPPVEKNILDIVTSNPSLTILKDLLDQAEMTHQLRRSGQFTLFAPTDAAFRKLDPALGLKLLEGHMCLDSILKNHLLENVICSSILDGRVKAENTLGHYLNLSRTEQDHLMVNEAEFIVKDVMATNGVVHVIDTVLLPEEARTVLEMAEKAGANKMIELLEEAGLLDQFAQMENFTLFLPTDEAFENLPELTLKTLEDNPEALVEMLKYHLVLGQSDGEDLLNDHKLDTFGSDHKITIKKYHSYPFSMRHMHTAQCAPIARQDLRACGGVAHLLEQVMMPPATDIMQLLKSDPQFSRLVEMLADLELSDILAYEGPFTFFAPNNDAWEEIDKDDELKKSLENPANLMAVMERHIVKGSLCCAGVMNSQHGLWRNREATLNRRHHLSINRNRQNQVILGSEATPVKQCDLTAGNGVVHVVDRVMPDAIPRRHQGHRRGKWMRDIEEFFDKHWDEMDFDFDWDLK